MPLRMAITKSTAQGETMVVDISQWNPVSGEIMHDSIKEMTELADAALTLGDSRMMEMNTRMLEAYELEKYFEPATWARVVCILDILAGRQSAETVARRWYSEVEETEALAAARQAHMQEQNGVVDTMCSVCHEHNGYHTSVCSAGIEITKGK
jgi:cytochrome c553